MLGLARAALLSSVAFVRQSYADTVTALNPIAYWHLGEPGGTTIVDEKDVQNNGIYEGTTLGTIEYGLDPIVQNSIAASAVAFDGIHTYGRIPHNPNFALASYTVDFAFQADTAPAVGQNQVLFTKDVVTPAPAGALSIEIYNNAGQLKLRAYAGGAAGNPIWLGGPGGAADLQLGKAYKVAVTVDPSDGARLYLDGIQKAHELTATVGWAANNTEPFVLGAYSVAALGKFDGVMDEVALFNYRLPPSDVRRLAQAMTIARESLLGLGMIVPRLDLWLTNDDMTIPGTGTVRYATPGGSGVGGTTEGAAGDLQTTLSASAAGDTVVCLQGYYNVPSGLNFPAGTSAGSPVTVMAKPGAWAVLCPDTSFLNIGLLDAGAGEGSAKTWTLHDAATNTWRTPYSGGASTLEGCYFMNGMAHMLFPYPSLTALLSDRDSGGSKPQTRSQYWFSGTAVSGGVAYIRFDRPNWRDMVNASTGAPDAIYGAWPDDGRYTVGVENGGSPTWFSRSNAADFKTGRPIIGQGLDPNTLRIYLVGRSNSTRVLNNASGNFTRMGSGMNSMGFRYYNTGRSNHEMHRGCHYLPGFWLSSDDAAISNVTAHRCRMFSYGEHRLQGSMAVMKFDEFLSPAGQMLQASHRNGFISVTNNNITNVTVENCTLSYWHEVIVGNPRSLNKLRLVHNVFHLTFDEFCQYPNGYMSQIEIGYNYMRDSAGQSSAATDSNAQQSPFGSEWCHHNIIDQRCCRSAFDSRTPFGGPNAISRSIVPQQGATKTYNNTIILNPDEPTARGICMGWAGSDENVVSAPNTQAYDEAFNNIIIRADTKRYSGSEGGTNARSDCTDWGSQVRCIDGTGFNQHYRDYNLYHRNVPVDPATGNFTRKKIFNISGRKFPNTFHFDYMRAQPAGQPAGTVFYGSSEWVRSRDGINQPGGNGWEHNGSDEDPQIPSVDSFPAQRMDYRPQNTAATGTGLSTSISGANWWTSPGWTSYGATPIPFNMAPSPWKGALDPNGTTVPVGVQNP